MRAKKLLKITQRISTVTNSFVQSVLPHGFLSDEEQVELRKQLHQDSKAAWSCVYCGAAATEWDHLQPLVAKRRPSGHLNVYGNLVPACGMCNHSKGAQDWRKWIMGRARNSPASRAIGDLEDRIDTIASYERSYAGRIEISDLYDAAAYEEYWSKLVEIEALMREAQRLADGLRDAAENLHPTQRHTPAGT
jgi:hypothetical protein